MFVRINHLFINTDTIETLGIFEVPTENNYEIGLVVNNNRYSIYNVSGNIPVELIQELQFNVIGIAEQIVDCARVEQKQIIVPAVDFNKYRPVPEEVVETPVEKEQIND